MRMAVRQILHARNHKKEEELEAKLKTSLKKEGQGQRIQMESRQERF